MRRRHWYVTPPQDPDLDPRKRPSWARIMRDARNDVRDAHARMRRHHMRVTALILTPLLAVALVAGVKARTDGERRITLARATAACSQAYGKAADAYNRAEHAYEQGKARADSLDENVDLDKLFEAVKTPPERPAGSCLSGDADRTREAYERDVRDLDAYARRITGIIG